MRCRVRCPLRKFGHVSAPRTAPKNPRNCCLNSSFSNSQNSIDITSRLKTFSMLALLRQEEHSFLDSPQSGQPCNEPSFNSMHNNQSDKSYNAHNWINHQFMKEFPQIKHLSTYVDLRRASACAQPARSVFKLT